jgi:hypothetical protein
MLRSPERIHDDEAGSRCRLTGICWTSCRTFGCASRHRASYRLHHDPGQHDDRAVSLGLAALALTERPEVGFAAVTSAVGVSIAAHRGGVGAAPRTAYSARASRGVLSQIAAAQAAQTPTMRRHGIGLAVPGSANDRG